jgi:hypothetical protein
MSRGTRWTAEQLQQAQARMGHIPVAVQRVPGADSSPGVDMDRVHRKFGNRKVTNEHGTFDSEKEARRYGELVMLERAGRIAKLRRQVPYALVVNGIHVCDYVADAVYSEGARLVVEDTKSVATRKERAYRIKVKLMLAVHGIEVKEV